MNDREAFEAWAGKREKYHTTREWDAMHRAWQAATAAERERCAKVCLEWADAHAKDTGICTYGNCDFVAAAMDCADAIRKAQ